MSTYVDKPLSLIERKKQQWAREREELAGLSAPWGCTKDSGENTRTRNVTNLASASSTNADLFSRRDSNASRRQSLPPIYRNQAQTYVPNEKPDKELGGETSGYGSDNPNNTPEYFQQPWNQSLGGYESSSSARDDRAKWGDRGVGIGKFWDPQDMKYNSQLNDTPGWVKRGLQGDTELVVSNTSPAESPEQDDGEQRPYTSSSISQTRTYIRGQNNPVDPVELAERERKRQLARAHQEAIKQQLEEREQRRIEEKERRIREEHEEELRIEREQEIERQRREYEHKILREKQERERKRKQALEEAIQLAEKQAQEHKMKQKMMKQVHINISNINENIIEKDKVISPRPFGGGTSKNTKNNNNNYLKIHHTDDEEEDDPKSLSEIQKQNNVSYITNPTNCSNNNNNINSNNHNNNAHLNKINEKKESNINRNKILAPTEQVPLSQPVPPLSVPQPPAAAPPPPSLPAVQENVMMLQTSFDGYQPLPFAILMPTYNTGPTTPLPVAVPLPANSESTPRPRTENRILTPTQYRHRRFCDSSTQTDSPSSQKVELDQNRDVKYIREKFVNLDINYEGRTRKDSRSRTSERIRDPGDRPKWGANRPPTRYLKQSEKDPFYLRKKSRQKPRQIKLYDDKNNNYSPHSSDDSQTASPRTYRKKGYIEKRRTRALWQKNEHVFARNVQVYQTEIVPLESDKDHIYYKKAECIKCCCDCRSEKHKYSDEIKVVDILKIEHTPREDVQFKDNEGCLPECNNSSIDSEVLEKLNSLHNGLMLKQEQWQNSPRTPSLCSPTRTTELNS